MSKSKLITYTRLTKKRNHPRNHVIDTITIHCYVGQVTAKAGCDYFATTDRECSANYVVGYDGSIGLSVDESDRSWCSSNADNDNRAVTIEVASDDKEPYAVTDKAYGALIELVADICKRNNIKKLLWKADKSLIGQVGKQNMTVHRWFAQKSCPGNYLYEHHGDIADKVNKILGVSDKRPDEYSHDGLVFSRAKNFKIVYHDEKKRNCTAQRYINGGFFANYADAKKKIFTLPVANLMCDVDVSRVDESAKKYILPHVEGRKLRYDIADNQSGQYKGKFVSTLVVPRSGKPYIADMGNVPSDAVYAISGVPTVRNGDDVDYYRYVKSQGWDESCMGAACRNWIGIRNGEIWIISGRTPVRNYIYGMWFWQRVMDEGFDDAICLDGGGSYVRKPVGGVGSTAENRRINNIIEF